MRRSLRVVVRVLNELGPDAGEKIRAAVPEAETIDLSFDGPPDDVDVIFGGIKSGVLAVDEVPESVRWIALASTGIDQAPAELFDRGAVVTCARGASAIPIAEFVLAEMLAFEKRVPEIWLDEPPEHWNLKSLGTLWGRTLGLVGLGGIGVEVARRALAFDMQVIATRRSDTPSPLEGVGIVDLPSVLARADHLVLAVPATAQTHRLLDAGALATVKEGVHLVNVARGSLIDQDALRLALDDGRVAMASLDVCDPEPLPAGHWLYDHPRVRLSAHVSWASPQWIERSVDGFVENLRRYVAGDPLEGVVDPAEGY